MEIGRFIIQAPNRNAKLGLKDESHLNQRLNSGSGELVVTSGAPVSRAILCVFLKLLRRAQSIDAIAGRTLLSAVRSGPVTERTLNRSWWFLD